MKAIIFSLILLGVLFIMFYELIDIIGMKSPRFNIKDILEILSLSIFILADIIMIIFVLS